MLALAGVGALVNLFLFWNAEPLDAVPQSTEKTTLQQNATPAQLGDAVADAEVMKALEDYWWRRLDSNPAILDAISRGLVLGVSGQPFAFGKRKCNAGT
jgi:hypothetical protein